MSFFDTYTKTGNTPLSFRALSPNHAGEISREYLEIVIDRAVKYGFNQIHVANNGWMDRLDQFVHYTAFPGLEDLIPGHDPQKVDERIELFQWFTKLAAEANLETYIWHRELGFPKEYAQLVPEGFIPDTIHNFQGDAKLPVPDLEHDAIWDLITKRFEEAYSNVPDLTGVIMTMQESDIPIYHLADNHEDRVSITLRMYNHLNDIHKKLGKKWILRSFAWREWEYAAVTEALSDFDPSVPIEIKDVPMDWHLYYPMNGLIPSAENQTKLVEMDPGGQYWGDGEVPVIAHRYYGEHLKFASEYGFSGVVARTDRKGGHTFDKPLELNIAVIGALANNPSADINQIEIDWIADTYGKEDADTIKQIFDCCWEASKRIFYINAHQGLHRFYLKLRGVCNIFVAERDQAFEPGDYEFMHEIELCEVYVSKAEELLQGILDEREYAPQAPLPPSRIHHPVQPAPAPMDELIRQIQNLRIYHGFYNTIKQALHAQKCAMYTRTQEARDDVHALVDHLEAIVTDQPGLIDKNPDFIEEFRYVIDNRAEREIIDAAHYSQGMAFRNKSYALPFPEPLTAELQVKPDADNILVLIAGTHMCRVARAEVDINGQIFPIERGVMSWYWAYDGWKRAEIEIPSSLCKEGTIQVRVLSESWDEAPYINEIRTEQEYEGYKPRKD